jgi:hypothetical protein
MSPYFPGMMDSTRRTGASRNGTCVSAQIVAAAAHAAVGSPNVAACSAPLPERATTQRASVVFGISAAASSMSARTGVVPGVPMISGLVSGAPSQCE